MLILRLKLGDMADCVWVTFDCSINCIGFSVFSLNKIVDGEITNTSLSPSVALRYEICFYSVRL